MQEDPVFHDSVFHSSWEEQPLGNREQKTFSIIAETDNLCILGRLALSIIFLFPFYFYFFGSAFDGCILITRKIGTGYKFHWTWIWENVFRKPSSHLENPQQIFWVVLHASLSTLNFILCLSLKRAENEMLIYVLSVL